MNILEKLYYGEISPHERWTDYAPGFRREMKKVSAADKALRDHLTPEQKELLDQYNSIKNSMITLEAKDSFFYGFRLGLLMALEACDISDRYMSDVGRED